jgi:phage major head subunit gpT-like protein
MAAMTQSNASYVSDETVAVLIFDEMSQYQPRFPSIYTQQGSSAYREVQGSMSGLTDFQEKTELEDPSEDYPLQQFKKEYLHREWALSVKIDRKVYEDENFPFFQKLGNKLGQSAIRTIEKQAAAVFNEAFSSSTYHAEDALSLCNSAHVNAAGGNSQANAGTTAFGYDALNTTMTAMRRFTGYRAEEIMIEPDLIIHPVSIDRAVFESIKSKGDPDEANLVSNYFNGKVSSLSWSYLDASDTNNWFLVDSRMMKANLFWYWRMALETFGDGDAFKGLRRIGSYYRSSHSAVDWRWVYGHNVA